MMKIVLIFFFALHTSNDDLNFWKKHSKKVSFIGNLLISIVEGFLKSNFDLNQICKIVCSDNYRLNIWNKTEKCPKIRQNRKSLTSTLLSFLTLLPELRFSGISLKGGQCLFVKSLCFVCISEKNL